jgi:anti-sigma factor RsiW
MTCEELETELVGYHFGVLADEARQRVEGHLVECPSCVRAFVGVKRSIERSEDVPAPPEGGRARLRLAVARAIGPRAGSTGTLSAFEPIGAAPPALSWRGRALALSVAASVVLAAGATTDALMSLPGTAPYAVRARP